MKLKRVSRNVESISEFYHQTAKPLIYTTCDVRIINPDALGQLRNDTWRCMGYLWLKPNCCINETCKHNVWPFLALLWSLETSTLTLWNSDGCEAWRHTWWWFESRLERRYPYNWGWGCSSVPKASDRHAADAGSIPRCGKGFFSQRQLSVQALLRCPYTPRVQSHAFTSVRTLKIPWSMSDRLDRAGSLIPK